MKRYVIPKKQQMQKWREFFEEVFRDEANQSSMLKTLVGMAMVINSDDFKHNTAVIDLLDASMSYALELVETGTADEEDVEPMAQLAYEFCYTLVMYMKEIGILKASNEIKFEGFLGMDIIVKILDKGETDETQKVALDGFEQVNG